MITKLVGSTFLLGIRRCQISHTFAFLDEPSFFLQKSGFISYLAANDAEFRVFVNENEEDDA